MAITSESLRTGQSVEDFRPDVAGTLLGYLRLPARGEIVRHARGFVRLALASSDALSGAIDDAELIVSELVTNVVRHGISAAKPVAALVLSRADALLRIEVHDANHHMPVQRTPGSADEQGRGLTIVRALSERWGRDVTRDGKRVWCELTAWLDETTDQTA